MIKLKLSIRNISRWIRNKLKKPICSGRQYGTLAGFISDGSITVKSIDKETYISYGDYPQIWVNTEVYNVHVPKETRRQTPLFIPILPMELRLELINESKKLSTGNKGVKIQ